MQNNPWIGGGTATTTPELRDFFASGSVSIVLAKAFPRLTQGQAISAVTGASRGFCPGWAEDAGLVIP